MIDGQVANGANNTGQRLRKIVVSHQPRGGKQKNDRYLLKQIRRGAAQKVLKPRFCSFSNLNHD
jgi:hypothetical protein